MRLGKNLYLKIFLVILLLLILFAASYLIVQSRSRHVANSDFFSFWLASKLLVNGQSPYEPDLWESEHQANGATWRGFDTYLYPPALALMIFPIALLGIFDGYVSWVFFSIVSLIISIFLITNRNINSKELLSYYIPFLSGSFLFRPFIVTLLHGQICSFLFLFILLALMNL